MVNPSSRKSLTVKSTVERRDKEQMLTGEHVGTATHNLSRLPAVRVAMKAPDITLETRVKRVLEEKTKVLKCVDALERKETATAEAKHKKIDDRLVSVLARCKRLQTTLEAPESL